LSTPFLNANLLRGGRGDLTYGFYGGFPNKKYRFAEFLRWTRPEQTRTKKKHCSENAQF
jgi:hypothetical protein